MREAKHFLKFGGHHDHRDTTRGALADDLVDRHFGADIYTAGGLIPPLNWTTAHTKQIDCYAVLKVVDGKFKPVYGKKGKPFLCYPDSLKKMPKNPQVSS